MKTVNTVVALAGVLATYAYAACPDQKDCASCAINACLWASNTCAEVGEEATATGLEECFGETVECTACTDHFLQQSGEDTKGLCVSKEVCDAAAEFTCVDASTCNGKGDDNSGGGDGGGNGGGGNGGAATSPFILAAAALAVLGALSY